MIITEIDEAIGIDYDETLMDTHGGFVDFHDKHYGTRVKKDDFTPADRYKVWGIPEQEVLARFKEFVLSGGHDEIKPLPGAVEMIERLHSLRKNLHIITYRSPNMKFFTQDLAERHFPRKFKGIHFCGDGGKVVRSKSSVCKQIGASYLLEDHLDTAISAAMDGVKVFLFDQPWNRQKIHALPEGVIRVTSWQDKALELLLS